MWNGEVPGMFCFSTINTFGQYYQNISEKNFCISYTYEVVLNKPWNVLEWSSLNVKQITARNERIQV